MANEAFDLMRELNALAQAEAEVVEIPGTKKSVKVGYLKRCVIRRVSDVFLDKRTGAKQEERVLCKAAALIALNDEWKIRLFYWIKWRWYHYVYQWQDYQCLPVLVAAKKKVQPSVYYVAMALLSGLNDCQKAMTREEALSRQSPS